MRIAWLLLLVAVPSAGGIGFVEIDGPDTSACGEGCLLLEPGERVLHIAPAQGRRALWLAEDATGSPVATGVVLEAAFVELPAGAARVHVTPL